MQTVKSQAPDEVVTVVTDRNALAREHAALFPARLALARLGNGAGLLHLHDAAGAHAPLRAAWLAQAQRDFQAWLDNGGFTQYDEIPANGPPSASTDTQQDNACID